ncbi:F-box only protein 44-like [Phymastichus coffea]|uniref:F-box only protein 44-like n=1 Tax=Phymastichus coffea TaxID=108790 RepID=UPI00273C7FCD|nr:F-box only protein 44-like [Phymastichus coffea]
MLQIENIETSNGLILETSYIPEELLIEILLYVDCRQLVLCHLVCKQWNKIIKESVWRKKAEINYGRLLFINQKLPWSAYFFISNKKLFQRNLLESTNNKVSYAKDEFESIHINVKDNSHPINVLPFPEDPLFKKNINCIKVVHDDIISARRKFSIDLIQEGFTNYILDILEPIIEVSEWYYTTQEHEEAEFECSIKLLNSSNVYDGNNRVMRVYHFHKRMNKADLRGKWFKFTHVFKNYGPGIRRIKFYDGGHHNIIMTGASVMMTVPSKKNVSGLLGLSLL